MARDDPTCCRCGATEEDYYWGPAEGYDQHYCLCVQCMDTILAWWIVDHYEQLESFAQGKGVRQ